MGAELNYLTYSEFFFSFSLSNWIRQDQIQCNPVGTNQDLLF